MKNKLKRAINTINGDVLEELLLQQQTQNPTGTQRHRKGNQLYWVQ